ncbi:hypothetical protein BDZ88DRAFT_431027 [Geranomyces variabilis]|nr:hypothetical protein BDZ88DRAFT_431027 [Geranomyces variabilis]KAJ3132762.1 Acidic leucine-rich nuclear phosphoprotein 32 member [Geranomyces variabilis]
MAHLLSHTHPQNCHELFLDNQKIPSLSALLRPPATDPASASQQPQPPPAAAPALPADASSSFNSIDAYTNLHHLSLNNCGLTSVARFPSLPRLARLDLGDNRIATGLDALLGCPALTSIDLSGNRIASLDTLKPLAQLPALRYLNLLECDVTRTIGPTYPADVFALLPQLIAVDDKDRQGNEMEIESDDDEEEEDEDDDDEHNENDDIDDDDQHEHNHDGDLDDGEDQPENGRHHRRRPHAGAGAGKQQRSLPVIPGGDRGNGDDSEQQSGDEQEVEEDRHEEEENEQHQDDVRDDFDDDDDSVFGDHDEEHATPSSRPPLGGGGKVSPLPPPMPLPRSAPPAGNPDEDEMEDDSNPDIHDDDEDEDDAGSSAQDIADDAASESTSERAPDDFEGGSTQEQEEDEDEELEDGQGEIEGEFEDEQGNEEAEDEGEDELPDTEDPGDGSAEENLDDDQDEEGEPGVSSQPGDPFDEDPDLDHGEYEYDDDDDDGTSPMLIFDANGRPVNGHKGLPSSSIPLDIDADPSLFGQADDLLPGMWTDTKAGGGDGIGGDDDDPDSIAALLDSSAGLPAADLDAMAALDPSASEMDVGGGVVWEEEFDHAGGIKRKRDGDMMLMLGDGVGDGGGASGMLGGDFSYGDELADFGIDNTDPGGGGGDLLDLSNAYIGGDPSTADDGFTEPDPKRRTPR